MHMKPSVLSRRDIVAAGTALLAPPLLVSFASSASGTTRQAGKDAQDVFSGEIHGVTGGKPTAQHSGHATPQ